MKTITILMILLLGAAFRGQELQLTEMASGFTSPVEITNAGDDRLFVVEQTGAIKIVNPDGSVNPTNFLTLTNATILTGGERGLLGLAFHPDYAENGLFYVNYTRAGDGATVIAHYVVSDDPDVADPDSELVLMEISQPFPNHNGGTIKFGPDGYLYIGMGDGGSGGDPGNRAQNIETNLGKILRIDVNTDAPYGSPATNPFIDINGNDEIWAIGMRNPWKFSFNRLNGDLWVADVGQDAMEEINYLAAPVASGLNFGWRCYEGTAPFNTADCPAPSSLVMPVFTYTHASAPGPCVSITGGYEYTGSQFPNLFGKYVFADYCFPRIGMLDDDFQVTYTEELSGLSFITTFGEDVDGELYVTGPMGILHKIVDVSLGTTEIPHSKLSIYPNPAKDEINIKNASDDDLVRFKLYDLSGKMLVNKQLNDIEVNTISVSGIQMGMYIATIENSNGALFNTRLIIN